MRNNLFLRLVKPDASTVCGDDRTGIASIVLLATAAHASAQEDFFWSVGTVGKPYGALIQAATDQARVCPPRVRPLPTGGIVDRGFLLLVMLGVIMVILLIAALFMRWLPFGG
jgi:hypothetical protein